MENGAHEFREAVERTYNAADNDFVANGDHSGKGGTKDTDPRRVILYEGGRAEFVRDRHKSLDRHKLAKSQRHSVWVVDLWRAEQKHGDDDAIA